MEDQFGDMGSGFGRSGAPRLDVLEGRIGMHPCKKTETEM